jgi:hypothetical protein
MFYTSLENIYIIYLATTQNGKKYQILNLPYYLASQIEKYIAWFIQTKKADSN